MPGIASKLRKYWPELVWLAFVAANLLLLVTHPSVHMVPIHVVWVSLTLLYGFRLWQSALAAKLLGLVVVSSCTALSVAVVSRGEEYAELAEFPLLALMFGGMVWHAQRRQRAAEELERMAKKQREFVRNASHQFRTPITVASGYAELIAAVHADDQTGDDARVVVDELQQLAAIADRLLILAGAQHPEFLSWGTVDVRRLIESTAHRWSRRAKNRRWEFDVDDVRFGGDEDQLNMALDALIENAVRFTRPGERIRLEGRDGPDGIVIRVIDEGAGIPAADLDSIFDPFRRPCFAPRSRTHGTGLGLAIVKAIVEGHRGTLGVESSANEGTTFELRLPSEVPSSVSREQAA